MEITNSLGTIEFVEEEKKNKPTGIKGILCQRRIFDNIEFCIFTLEKLKKKIYGKTGSQQVYNNKSPEIKPEKPGIDLYKGRQFKCRKKKNLVLKTMFFSFLILYFFGEIVEIF